MSVSAVAVDSSPPIPVPSADAPVEQRVDYVVQQAKMIVEVRDPEYNEVLESIPASALPEYLKPLDSWVSDASVRQLPPNGQISLGEIGQEGGKPAGGQVSINEAACRDLIGKASATEMSFDEWYGASATPALPPATLSGTNRWAPDGPVLPGRWDDYTLYNDGVAGQAGDLIVTAGLTPGQRDKPESFAANSVGNIHSTIQNERGTTLWNGQFGIKRHLIGYDHNGTGDQWFSYQNNTRAGDQAKQLIVGFRPPSGVRYKLALVGITEGAKTETHTVAGAVGWIAKISLLGSRPNPRPQMVPSKWTELGAIENGQTNGAYYEQLACLLVSGDTVTVTWPSAAERTICAIVHQ